jgi:hypothetical protein
MTLNIMPPARTDFIEFTLLGSAETGKGRTHKKSSSTFMDRRVASRLQVSITVLVWPGERVRFALDCSHDYHPT